MAVSTWPAWAMRLFGGLLAGCGGIRCARRMVTMQHAGTNKTSSKVEGSKVREFRAFQLEYLLVYLTVMLADWLQGTNMYTLYSGYGFPVSQLFLTGFSSSLVFGTFVGLLVDRYGRRLACIAFCVLEIIINLLEHVPHMPTLLFGRCLGGVSTSLLFSAFESWMVSEHRRRGFDEEWLASTFSLAAAGNGIVAVIAGFLAQVAADLQGDIGPFRLAILLTVLSLCLVAFWPENYGQQAKTTSSLGPARQSFVDARRAISADTRVALLACVAALFEGATFTFVFMWVPTLLGKYDGALPMGLVFACFMISIAAGGELFGLLVADANALVFKGRVERFAFFVLAAASAAMIVPSPPGASFAATLASFLVLEVCVGTFNGCAATMRSKYIPDALQGSIMNVSRIPLNLLVVAGTTMADIAPPTVTFSVVSATFALGALLQLLLIQAQRRQAVKAD
ncbi:hypothetical protein CTAYLR_002422 [Chrysophaeum taylorii]|uniref:Molybdate-anion transporter n=1 Tax=Chrysophaeum taylorii TaxID=2483200 RepID=A0AAD7XQX2_9STRA|nr:hypothetical protein CTAYLR_002422 [Chrysophaeum taylorii]